MPAEITPIDADQSFRFACEPGVPCFNACCRDLNQFLTPYDILRLKNALGLPSRQFLKLYTRTHIGPQTGLPVVSLVPGDRRERTCPFLEPGGCRVYPDRPSSCRTYPLMRILRRDRQTGRLTEEFMLLKETHCLGFNAPKRQTPREWIREQGISRYNRFNDLMMEIIGMKGRRHPGPLSRESTRRISAALYDLDGLRAELRQGKPPGDAGMDSELLSASMDDDEVLLKVGIRQVIALLSRMPAGKP